MSVAGTALIVITALILEPLWGDVQSPYLPTLTVYDIYDKTTATTESAPQIVMTLHIPNVQEDTKTTDLDVKRQFDPWGGKKRSKISTDAKNLQHKRQFSPWGGKRSSVAQSEHFDEGQEINGPSQHQFRKKNSLRKRSFNSWSSRRTNSMSTNIPNASAWGGKRNFNSWGGKRSPNHNSRLAKRYAKWRDNKRNAINSWSGKKSLNSWGEKRLLNSWDEKKSFNSWGGKRNFNSWGGKRTHIGELRKRLTRNLYLDPFSFSDIKFH